MTVSGLHSKEGGRSLDPHLLPQLEITILFEKIKSLDVKIF